MAEKRIGWCLIPPGIFSRTDISQSQKMLIGRIVGLVNNDGYCYASNKWLGEQLGITKGQSANIIMDLHRRGFLKIELIRNENKRIIERRIYPVYEDLPIQEKLNTYSGKTEYPIQEKLNTPIQEKLKGSNRDKSNRERENTFMCDSDLTKRENLFEEFWKLYPYRRGKKLHKKEARELFMKLKSASVAPILQAVRNYAVSKTVTDGYAKDAVRFLKNDFWQDWLEPENTEERRTDDDRFSFPKGNQSFGSCIQGATTQ